LADEKNKKKSTTQQKATGSSWWHPLKKLLKLAHNKTGNTTRLPLEVILSKKKNQRRTRRPLRLFTKHKTTTTPTTNPCSLQSQSAPQNLIRERKNYEFHWSVKGKTERHWQGMLLRSRYYWVRESAMASGTSRARL
jgi:hypothetical protein